MKAPLTRFLLLALAATPTIVHFAQAAPFQYVNGDLLVCFRRLGGESDLVVNLGPVSALESLAPGISTVVTRVEPARLASAFPNLDGLRWSVLGALRGNTNFPQHPIQTLWISSPFPDPETPGSVWKRRGSFSQGATASQIEAIGLGGLTYGSQVPAGANNTNHAIVLPPQDLNAYSFLMSAEGNLSGTFPGTVEALTPEPFEATGSRAGLFRLIPGSGVTLNTPGLLVGIFHLSPEGVLSFTPGAPAPRILSVERIDPVTRIRTSTTPGYTYRLRFTGTEGVGSPVSDWSTAPGPIPGTGSTEVLEHADPRSAVFYAVEVLP